VDWGARPTTRRRIAQKPLPKFEKAFSVDRGGLFIRDTSNGMFSRMPRRRGQLEPGTRSEPFWRGIGVTVGNEPNSGKEKSQKMLRPS